MCPSIFKNKWYALAIGDSKDSPKVGKSLINWRGETTAQSAVWVVTNYNVNVF